MYNDDNLLPVALVIAGVTGSGKSVPVDWAIKKGYCKISTGDYFRETNKELTARRQLCPTAEANEYVRTHPMMGKERLVLDGYPRTQEQAVFALDLLKQHTYRIFLVSLQLGSKEAARRIVLRRATSPEKRSDDQASFDKLVEKAEMQHKYLLPTLLYFGPRVDGRVCICTQYNDPDMVRKRLDEFYARQTEQTLVAV